MQEQVLARLRLGLVRERQLRGGHLAGLLRPRLERAHVVRRQVLDNFLRLDQLVPRGHRQRGEAAHDGRRRDGQPVLRSCLHRFFSPVAIVPARFSSEATGMPKGEREREQVLLSRTALVAARPCEITSLSEEARQRGRV